MVEEQIMDATRSRRTKDRVRQAWYAQRRQHRFAHRLGFTPRASNRQPSAVPGPTSGPVGRSESGCREGNCNA